MAAIQAFPLLGLPDDVVLRTLREMDLKQILMLPLISKRCQNLVSSMKIKGTSVHVHIRNEITISIKTISSRISLSYYTEPNKYWSRGAYGRKKRLTPPLSVLINEGYPTTHPSKWEKRDFTMKTWLKHLQNVFNFHKIDSIEFSDRSSQFDIDDIKDVFRNIPVVYIDNAGRVAFNQMILQHFSPIDKLTIVPESFLGSKIPPSLLMENLVKLKLTEIVLDEPTNITLNDLLLINSKVIIVENILSPQKLLNSFIKLWQKGSNPNLEYLCVDFLNNGENDEQIIMKGIKYEVNRSDQVRKSKSVEIEYSVGVSGGFDIYRMDGVKATIKIKYEETFAVVEMYVWFDHCVVEP